MEEVLPHFGDSRFHGAPAAFHLQGCYPALRKHIAAVSKLISKQKSLRSALQHVILQHVGHPAAYKAKELAIKAVVEAAFKERIMYDKNKHKHALVGGAPPLRVSLADHDQRSTSQTERPNRNGRTARRSERPPAVEAGAPHTVP
eukprot:752481-Prymnesium_polylepis.1